MNYELYMAEAIAEAQRGAEEGESPIGAVAVLDDAMIARDHRPPRWTATRPPTPCFSPCRRPPASSGHRLSRGHDLHHLEPCAMCVGRSSRPRSAPRVRRLGPERGAAGSVIQLARNPALAHQLSVISGVRESGGAAPDGRSPPVAA